VSLLRIRALKRNFNVGKRISDSVVLNDVDQLSVSRHNQVICMCNARSKSKRDGNNGTIGTRRRSDFDSDAVRGRIPIKRPIKMLGSGIQPRARSIEH